MHLIVANRIADYFSIKDRTSFLLGGIAPDAVSPKDLSHFYIGDTYDYSRGIDYEQFLHKYQSLKHSHYILGYYTHLIADDLWLKGFYLPWLKNRMERNPSIFNQYHDDFRLLNGKLFDHYGNIAKLQSALQQAGTIIDLEEVSGEKVIDFIPFVLGDMNFDLKQLELPLEVFTFEQIVGYIETSVDKSIMLIKPLLG